MPKGGAPGGLGTDGGRGMGEEWVVKPLTQMEAGSGGSPQGAGV